MNDEELARLLHIDQDDVDMISNANMCRAAAEEYLRGAGIQMDYENGLYKLLIVVLITRSLDRPDMLTKFADMPGSGVVAMIAQLRLSQQLEKDFEDE